MVTAGDWETEGLNSLRSRLAAWALANPTGLAAALTSAAGELPELATMLDQLAPPLNRPNTLLAAYTHASMSPEAPVVDQAVRDRLASLPAIQDRLVTYDAQTTQLYDIPICFRGVSIDVSFRTGDTICMIGGSGAHFGRVLDALSQIEEELGESPDSVIQELADQAMIALAPPTVTRTIANIERKGLETGDWGGMLDSLHKHAHRQPHATRARGASDPAKGELQPESDDAKRLQLIESVMPDLLAEVTTYPAGTIGHAKGVYARLKEQAQADRPEARNALSQLRQTHPNLFPKTTGRRAR